jgi:hypothetical protein
MSDARGWDAKATGQLSFEIDTAAGSPSFLKPFDLLTKVEFMLRTDAGADLKPIAGLVLIRGWSGVPLAKAAIRPNGPRRATCEVR